MFLRQYEVFEVVVAVVRVGTGGGYGRGGGGGGRVRLECGGLVDATAVKGAWHRALHMEPHRTNYSPAV